MKKFLKIIGGAWIPFCFFMSLVLFAASGQGHWDTKEPATAFLIFAIIGLILFFVFQIEKRGKNIRIAENQQLIDAGFQRDKQIIIPSGFNKVTFCLDSHNKKFAIKSNKQYSFSIYDYKDLLDFELMEDGETKAKAITKGGLSSALIGAALFGPAGAIVGGVTARKKTTLKNNQSCNSLRIKVVINDLNRPSIYFDFISSPTPRDGWMFKTIYAQAQECLSILQIIINESQPQNIINDQKVVSETDEILKFKDLLDKGAITQEEFEAKKKQLLKL